MENSYTEESDKCSKLEMFSNNPSLSVSINVWDMKTITTMVELALGLENLPEIRFRNSASCPIAEAETTAFHVKLVSASDFGQLALFRYVLKWKRRWNSLQDGPK